MPKISYVICLLVLTLISFKSECQDYSQWDPISVEEGEYQLTRIFHQLNKQGIKLAYSQDLVPKFTCIIDREYTDVEDLLDHLNDQVRFKFTVEENLIVLTFPDEINFRTLRGIVKDANSGEVLIGAIVYKVGSTKGVVTNSYGYYSLTLPSGNHQIRVSYLGYEDFDKEYDLTFGGAIEHYRLKEKLNTLEEVVVSSLEPDFNVTSLIPGINTLDLNTRGEIPYFMGEVDVLQGATLLPGITTLGEDANGLYVRGGSNDQNLILLDEAPVYNPNHLFGLISVFNPEAINNVDIMKGFIPPWFGGRASSIISIQQNEGDDQNFRFTGGIGLVSAKFIAEGPLKREESSFILSGRQSILNIALDENTSSRFQDLNAKVNWKPNKKNTFYFSGYFGNDHNTNSLETINQWGNRNFSTRWNHFFGKRIFAHFSTIISEYNYKITQPREAASFIGRSKIIDYTMKSDIGFVINPQHELRFGSSSIYHVLRPGDRVPFDEETSSANILSLDTEHGLETGFYVSHQYEISRKLSILYGLRFSNFSYLGADTVFQYAPNETKSLASIRDTITYNRFENVATYCRLEPRMSINYKTGKHSSIKASFTRSNQYLHLISNTISPSPTDTWKLSDQYVKPTSSDHYSLGYYQNLANNKYELYLDLYYKKISDLIEYKAGADLLFNPAPETELLSGNGRAYGMEIYAKKNEGDFKGWISYTLSKSENKVAGNFSEETINNGKYFPNHYDRLHDLSLVGIYQFNRRLSSSLSFNYNSGRPYSLPLGSFVYEGNVIPYFGDRNQYRLPDYHRLDLSLKWIGRAKNKLGQPRAITDYWTLVIYNVYSRSNVYSYFFKEDPDTGSLELVPNSIFDSIIPAITYNFNF